MPVSVEQSLTVNNAWRTACAEVVRLRAENDALRSALEAGTSRLRSLKLESAALASSTSDVEETESPLTMPDLLSHIISWLPVCSRAGVAGVSSLWHESNLRSVGSADVLDLTNGWDDVRQVAVRCTDAQLGRLLRRQVGAEHGDERGGRSASEQCRRGSGGRATEERGCCGGATERRCGRSCCSHAAKQAARSGRSRCGQCWCCSKQAARSRRHSNSGIAEETAAGCSRCTIRACMAIASPMIAPRWLSLATRGSCGSSTQNW